MCLSILVSYSEAAYICQLIEGIAILQVLVKASASILQLPPNSLRTWATIFSLDSPLDSVSAYLPYTSTALS